MHTQPDGNGIREYNMIVVWGWMTLYIRTEDGGDPSDGNYWKQNRTRHIYNFFDIHVVDVFGLHMKCLNDFTQHYCPERRMMSHSVPDAGCA